MSSTTRTVLKQIRQAFAKGISSGLAECATIFKASSATARHVWELGRWSKQRNSMRMLGMLYENYLAIIGYRRNLASWVRRTYPEVCAAGAGQREELRSREFKVFSQCGEDGILLYLLSRVGVSSRRAVELGAGGYTSNIANLIANCGWRGVFFDGSSEALANFRDRVMAHAPTLDDTQVTSVATWVTRENINDLLATHGAGDIDVISIDIDGNDYWVWEALTVRPRVVVIEYNALFGDEAALTVPYDPAFDRSKFHSSGKIFGCSLAALAKLGATKGYRLVGCDSWGVNAFFVREDLAEGKFEALSVREAFYEHFQWRQHIARLRPLIPALPLETV